MKIFFGFFVIICSNWVCSQKTPTISDITQNPITDIGGTAELTCSVLNATDFRVLWVKINREKVNEPIIISSGKTLIIMDSRYSLRQDVDNTTLQIKDIQETDAGFYQCQVLLGLNNNKISAEVELKVRRRPKISDNSTKSFLVVKNGQTVKLECYADGFPIPTVSWRRSYYAKLPSGDSIYRGNILEIPAITKEDRGTYYCVAENGVGRGVRRYIAVEVEFAPIISVPKPRVGQALHYDIDLVCHTEAYPPPEIVWLNNSVPLSYTQQQYRISHFSSDVKTDSTIRLHSIEKHQYGDYVCKVSNYLGTAEAIVNLYETAKPVCPPACDPVAVLGGLDERDQPLRLKNSTTV